MGLRGQPSKAPGGNGYITEKGYTRIFHDGPLTYGKVTMDPFRMVGTFTIETRIRSTMS